MHDFNGVKSNVVEKLSGSLSPSSVSHLVKADELLIQFARALCIAQERQIVLELG